MSNNKELVRWFIMSLFGGYLATQKELGRMQTGANISIPVREIRVAKDLVKNLPGKTLVYRSPNQQRVSIKLPNSTQGNIDISGDSWTLEQIIEAFQVVEQAHKRLKYSDSPNNPSHHIWDGIEQGVAKIVGNFWQNMH